MTSRYAAILGLLLTTIAPTPLIASPTDDFMELVGLAEELAFDIEENRQVLVALCAASIKCHPLAKDLVRAISTASKDLRLGPAIRPHIDEMLENMAEEHQKVLFDFYRSPVGRRVVAAEKQVRAPDQQALLASEGAQIYSRQTDERFAQLEAIDARADESAGQRGRDRFAYRIVEWLERRSEAKNLSSQESLLQEAPDRSRHVRHQGLAYAFEPFGDEELQLLVEFLATDPGEEWSNVRGEIRRRAVREAAEPILQLLTQQLGTGAAEN